MADPIEVLWSPAGVTVPSRGAKPLVESDTSDGDSPKLAIAIRMLSIDTPETTADTPAGAARVDEKFAQLAQWLRDRTDLPVTRRFAEYLIPKIGTGNAGTLHFQQGKAASAFSKANMAARLDRPHGPDRSVFVRTADAPFDNYGRLLAYLAPNYSDKERASMTRAERSTFNLDLVAEGWAAPFVIYPSIPGELDLPLFLDAAANAVTANKGIWSEALTMPAYEYRAAEKLHGIAADIVAGEKPTDRYGWRSRYCADLRTRRLHGPEDYFDIDPVYRLWIWPADLRTATADLNLIPTPRLTTTD
ncbi:MULTISPECIES: thermonuclease family protein [Nocardia]|uniref:thermonuclease family protein n=1 Tax=Nocardia TaxID=1817 RepID=UPI000D690525|nr:MULTISPECIES: thermonuclease family protein [Nocardia]